jgi:electron transfer flavoprotein-quinone oxidoreductase
MSEEQFDVIVVGAGLAGLAAAYTLAKTGREVLVIERGTVAGSKNVSGGRLYSYALEQIEPGLTAQARLERAVTREQIMLLDGDRAVTLEYSDPAYAHQPPQSYTVLRAVFDEWFAERVEAEGAIIAAGVQVDGLMEEDGRVVGVVAGGDEMRARVIVAADGVNSLLAQKAGLRPDLTPHEIGVGIKEVIALPAQTIESRFHLSPDEGAARMILGGSRGVNGGAFLYTNRESVSLGCVFLPARLAEERVAVHELFQDIKTHPAIAALIEGGQTVEYGAHLVPEAGWRHVPQPLHRPGLLVAGDAAGLVINQGYTIRGMDLALLSGLAAANAIKANDDVEAIGPAYVQELERLGLPAAMQQFERFPALMENPRLFTVYPALAADLFQTLYTLDTAVAPPLRKGLWQTVRQNTSLRELVKDGWAVARALK